MTETIAASVNPPGYARLGLRLAEWALPAAILLPMIFLPLTRDQGHYAYGAQVILDGGQLYRDVFDGKGPGTYYAYALALKLFGASETGARLFFYLVAVVGSGLAAALAGRIGGWWCRLGAALVFALAAMQGNSDCAWFTAEGEDLMLPLVLGAVLLLGRAEHLGSAWRLVGAGVLLGLAFLVKVTIVTTCFTLALVAAVVLLRQGAGWRGLLKAMLWTAAGMALPVAACLGYYAAQGLLGEVYRLTVQYNRAYGGIRLFRDFTDLFRPLTADRWRTLSVLAIAALALGPMREGAAWRLLWAAAAGGWLAAVWQGKNFPYQWTPVIGCLAVAAGVACGRLAQWAWSASGSRAWRVAAVAASLLLLPAMAGPTDVYYLNRIYRQTAGLLSGQVGSEEFRKVHRTGSTTADVTDRVAAYLRSHSQPTDTVHVWGYETIVNFLADRRSPSRFVLAFPLSQPGPWQKAWREEFLDILRQRPPLYVVVVHDDAEMYHGLDDVDSDKRLKEFPAMEEVLKTRYAPETRIERFELFRRQ
ncbi:MAG: hypothetical protein BWX88_01149 [Planctomycetes bacterium ADurb.Bin126]|nr:MAG: hypothetical protein BWX88_01149 [Planctomycetes bacterium ADurb.Bin126]HOD81235.1 glycosyltransferase family 39 protein [Phycisphaerae bacterium]HQL71799.1 glycosyltransferase family 39 protein [Phycisphaerae bacterium]